MNSDSLKSGRGRRTYAPEFKADMVAQCVQGDVSLASLAVDHGMNPNVLHRWVMEHERYGKHSLQDSRDELLADSSRDMTPANWIPLNAMPTPDNRNAVAPAPAKGVEAAQLPLAANTIALELAARDLTLTLHWPVQQHQALAAWARTLLT